MKHFYTVVKGKLLLAAFTLFQFSIIVHGQTTFTVTDNSDPGTNPDCSAPYTLRDAVCAASDGDIIVFDLGTNNIIQLATATADWWTGNIGVDKTLHINGENTSGPNVIIDGNSSEIFCFGCWAGAPDDPDGSIVENLVLVNSMTAINILDNKNVDDITIRNNHIGILEDGTTGTGYFNQEHGIYAQGADRINISGNTITGNLQNGVQLQDLDNAVISDNIVGLLPDGLDCPITGSTYEISSIGGGNGYDGLNFTRTNSSTVSGNTIGCNGFATDPNSLVDGFLGKRGIYFEGSDENIIIDNKIGTDITGVFAKPNYKSGILLSLGSDNNIVGGSHSDSMNIISGNGVPDGLAGPEDWYNTTPDKHGIVIDNGQTTESTNNRVSGNLIGLNINGAVLGNAKNGVEIIGDGNNNTIGGVTAAHGNVISGNGDNGVSVAMGSYNNTIQHNFIGTDINGCNTVASTGNGNVGVLFSSGQISDPIPPAALSGNVIADNIIGNNLIGVQSFGEEEVDGLIIQGNSIGIDACDGDIGNTQDGILIGTDLTNIEIGGENANDRNFIGNNGQHGINITAPSASGTNNLILGNYIGVLSDGVTQAANLNSGINIENNSQNITIGGSSISSGNLIVGNGQNGVIINGANVSSIDILYNSIGVDLNGNALANTNSGVQIINGEDIQIGGTGSDEGVLISGNGQDGILIEGGESININNSLIGTSLDGNSIIPNGAHGINITGGDLITIGGTNTGNVISGNSANGISIQNNSSTSIVVQSNLIGTNSTGNIALGNGTSSSGIYASNTSGLTIGGTLASGEGNIISGNNGSGIEFSTMTAVSTIAGNYIGLALDGATQLANLQQGISASNSSNITIGGSLGDGNVISGNGTGGDATTGNGINLNNTSTSTVSFNTIGLNANGDVAVGNTTSGISITGTSTTASNNNIITTNTIAGNTERAIYLSTSNNTVVSTNLIGTNTTGTDFAHNTEDILIEGDATNVTIGGTTNTLGNIFGGTTDANITIQGDANTVGISANYFGLDNTQSTAQTATEHAIIVQGSATDVSIGNGTNGNVIMLDNATNAAVIVQGAANNTSIDGNFIGVTQTSNGENTLSTSLGIGVEITGNASNTEVGVSSANHIGVTASHGVFVNGATVTTGTVISNNHIGVNSAAQNATGLSIGGHGVFVDGAINTTISSNLIGNIQDGNSGIQVSNSGSGTTSIDGNAIGINLLEENLGNTGNGIEIFNSNATVNIGSINGNVISGNDLNGISVNNSTNTTVEANIIGTNLTGDAAFANGESGISINSTSDGTIVIDNLIGGNTLAGITIDNSSNNNISTNLIGVQGDEVTAVSNGTDGILINNNSDNNTISDNIIAHNGGNGVQIVDAASVDNTITINSMFCNTLRGIEENGVANENYGNPVVSVGIDNSGVSSGGNSILCNPLGTYPTNATVEIFTKGACKACGSDDVQGMTYVATTNTASDGSLNFDIGFVIPEVDSNAYIITLTEFGPNSTSEFSSCSYWKITCEDPVAVVTPGPTTAICDGDSLELKATYNLDMLYTWYEATAPATPLNGAGSVANDSILYVSTAGDYYVTIADPLGCDSTSESVNVTVTTPPTVSDAGEDDTLCNQTFYSLSANHDAVGSGIWEMVTGTGTFVNIVSETAGVTDMVAPDTLTLVWTISEATNVCPPSRDTVIIINDAQPVADAGANDTICEDAFPYTLTASDPTTSISSSNGVWTLEAGTGTINDDQAHNTTVDDITVGGESTFRWTVTNGECSDFDEVIVVSDAIPTTADAGENDTICNTPTYTLAGNTITIGNGMWNVVSGTGTVTTPTSPISGVTGMSAPGELVLEWEATSEFGKCAANSTQVVIVNDEMPTANAGGTDQICVSSLPYTLSANNPTVGTGSWEVTSGTGTLEDATLFDSEIDAITAGTTPTITWTVVNGVCTATDDFDLTVDDAPSPAVAGTDANPCTPTTDLAATLPTTGTGTWMSLQGSATIDDPSSPTSELTGLIEGQLNELEWCVSLAGSICADTCDVVEITRLSNPITEVVLSEDSPVCEGDDITFTTVVTNGGTAPTYEWLVNDASQGAASTTANTFVTSTLSSGDDISVIVTGNDACVTDNIDTSNVVSPTIETTPEGDASGPTAVVCGDATTDLTGTVTSITGNGTWSVSSTSLATATINSTSGAITNISPVGTDLTVLYTVSNGTGAECPDDVNTVVVSSTPILTPDISITGDTEQCEGDDITVSIDTQTDLGTTPTFNWYVNGELVTTSGTSLTTDTLSQTSSISVAAISSETCVTSPSDSVAQSVDIVNVPTVAISGADFCPNETTTLTATPGASTYEWTLNPSTTLSETSESYTTGTEGTYSVIAINNGATVSCPSTPDQLGISEVEIVVDAGDDQEFKLEYDVASVTTTINGTSTINNNPVWTNSSGAVIDNPNTLSTAVTVEPGTYVFTLTDNNGTCSDSDQMTIKVTGKIKIHNAFSPPGNGNGGDGSNDEWVILGLDGFDKYTIKVFNRYGNLIREWEDVYTPWDGKSKAGDEFPVGTYWYVVDVPGDGQYAGSLTLMR